MTPRYGDDLLSLASARHDWATRDPMNVALPLKSRTHQPTCHCPSKTKRGQIGGCRPAISLSQDLLVCRTCLKPISFKAKTRVVQWLRGLLGVKLDRPEQFDVESLREVGYIVE